MEDDWKVWDKDKWYGDLFAKRATGELPEMESSKAVAKIISNIVKSNNTIIDVGCGAGHYLRSLVEQLKVDFNYWGIDRTEYYIKKGIEALGKVKISKSKRINTKFSVGDIFNLDVEDSKADIVMCNNVLLHLPSIEKPISELIRISREYVVIRMLIGRSSFRIKQVESPELYNKDGEPQNFHYYNIYSEEYVKRIFDSNEEVEKYEILDDVDFDPDAFGTKSNYLDEKPEDLTTAINGIQLNVYILQPWKFILIKKT